MRSAFLAGLLLVALSVAADIEVGSDGQFSSNPFCGS